MAYSLEHLRYIARVSIVSLNSIEAFLTLVSYVRENLSLSEPFYILYTRMLSQHMGSFSCKILSLN